MHRRALSNTNALKKKNKIIGCSSTYALKISTEESAQVPWYKVQLRQCLILSYTRDGLFSSQGGTGGGASLEHISRPPLRWVDEQVTPLAESQVVSVVRFKTIVKLVAGVVQFTIAAITISVSFNISTGEVGICKKKYKYVA